MRVLIQPSGEYEAEETAAIAAVFYRFEFMLPDRCKNLKVTIG
jgi:hypothetical protein